MRPIKTTPSISGVESGPYYITKIVTEKHKTPTIIFIFLKPQLKIPLPISEAPWIDMKAVAEYKKKKSFEPKKGSLTHFYFQRTIMTTALARPAVCMISVDNLMHLVSTKATLQTNTSPPCFTVPIIKKASSTKMPVKWIKTSVTLPLIAEPNGAKLQALSPASSLTPFLRAYQPYLMLAILVAKPHFLTITWNDKPYLETDYETFTRRFSWHSQPNIKNGKNDSISPKKSAMLTAPNPQMPLSKPLNSP